MALWGKTDTLASAPKYITRKAYFIASAVNLTENTIDLREPVSGTCFAVGDGVVYNNGGGTSATGLTSGSTYYVASSGTSGLIKLSDTEAHAKAGTNIIDITGQGNDAQYLQRNTEGNESTAEGNGDHTYNGSDIYFVDADEATQPSNRARGIKGPGWWAYRSWTNADGSVQHRCEQLIAMGAYAGATGSGTYQAQTGDNAADDAVVYDATTYIDTQPTDRTTTGGGGTSFVVVSSRTGAGSLTYQWQISNDAGATWSNLSNAGVYSGVALATLVISNTTGLNGKKYRVICGTSTANDNAISNAVTLTVTA